MIQLIFATNNDNKVKEIRSLLGDAFELITLREAGIEQDIPEPHDSLEANAREKSATIHGLTGRHCFGEDTGLEVEALNGEPGVKSARYAGEPSNPKENIALLLRKMAGLDNRRARFRTIISLIFNGREYQFEGICTGTITGHETGGNGFGYDPVFVPDGSGISFAEMDLAEKNRFSHRKKAFEKLVQFLRSQAQ